MSSRTSTEMWIKITQTKTLWEFLRYTKVCVIFTCFVCSNWNLVVRLLTCTTMMGSEHWTFNKYFFFIQLLAFAKTLWWENIRNAKMKKCYFVSSSACKCFHSNLFVFNFAESTTLLSRNLGKLWRWVWLRSLEKSINRSECGWKLFASQNCRIIYATAELWRFPLANKFSRTRL